MYQNKTKLYLDDCLNVMKEMNDGLIDLTVTSPPYDNLKNYNNTLFWDFDIFTKIAKELYRITKDGGIVVWVVSDETINGSETGTSFKQALFFKEIGFNLHDTMIYQKSGMAYPDSTRYHQIFEYMFVFCKGINPTFNPIKDRENKYKGNIGGNKRGGLCKRDDFGSRFNIWRYANGRDNSSKDRAAFDHPAIFPEGLANDHILSWSNPDETVFDPFMGSGTTGKMAVINNRNFIGIEKVEKYYNIAKDRIEGILC